MSSEKASVLFHFRKDGDGTRYFPTIKHKGQRIEFMFKGAQIITQNPAWMVLGNQLIDFEKNVDVAFAEVEELDQTGRGEGGFGSTGMGEILTSDKNIGADSTFHINPKFVTNSTANVKVNINS